jgi:hypothetical protein
MYKRKNDHLQTLHRKLEIENHDLHLDPGMNSCLPERYAEPVPLVALVVLL